MDDLLPVLVELDEPRRLEVEHRAVAPAARHQLVVRAELDDGAVLEHADAVGLAHGREAVRDEDRRAAARGVEDALEDLRLAAHVELGRRLVEQHDAGAGAHGAQRPGQRDALPLAARQVGAAGVALGQDRCRASARSSAPAPASAASDVVVGRRRRARRSRAAAARSGRSPGTPPSRGAASRRGRAGAGRRRRPRSAPPTGS